MINIYKIILAGTPEFPYKVFEKLIHNKNFEIISIITQPDRVNKRNNKILFSPIKKLAIKYNIKLLQPEKINNIFETIKKLDADLFLTCAYGQFISNEILNIPKFGSLNIHASLLPKLRGGAPIHHAVINGDTKTGITLMRMERKMDSGDILMQESIAIAKTDNVGNVHDNLLNIATDNIENWLEIFFNNQYIPVKQNPKDATFGLNVLKKDRSINWHSPGIEIYNRIRGLNPWPIAITNYENTTFKITKSLLIKETNNTEKIPGSIIEINKSGILVKTGSNENILITELIWPYKQKMSVANFIKGNNVFEIKHILN